MKLLKQLAVVLLLLLCSNATYAQLSSLTDGAVYHFQNVGNTEVALSASALSDVAASTSNTSDKSQQWYVKKSGNYYTFRNLANGRYLAGNGTSAAWGLTAESTADANLFELATAGSYNTIRSKANSSNSYAYMHKDGSNNIVGWESGANATRWSLTTVDYTAEQLQEVWNEVDILAPTASTVATYQSALDAIFSDDACTQLNSTYASMSVENIKADANYEALPEVLQAMVLKVKDGDWTEANGVSDKSSWDSEYAKKYRVQMYEPYSIAGEITSYLRIGAHLNMDNPTGLYANNGQPMYVMVEGEIADGAELWLAYQTGHGNVGWYANAAHTQLQPGLNVVPYFTDGCELWIDYVVHTYNSSGTTIEEKFPHKLSDYKPLKIHIEGGYINGYYNAIGDFRAADSNTDDLWGEVDNDADWSYIEARAPLTDVVLLGRRQLLKFNLNTTHEGNNGMSYYLPDVVEVPSKPYNNSGNFSDYTGMGLDASTGKINIMLEAWDRIMFSEHATMGLISTSAMDKMNEMYPRWTSDGQKAEIYNYGKSTVDSKTYAEFCQGLDYSEYYNHHGVAWGEFGSTYMYGGGSYCGYHHNTMPSIIGKIASEAGPTWGPAHEIGHQHQGVFNLNGQTEVTNNFFSNVAVWYMGMGTSRYNGSEGSLQNVLGAFNTEDNDAYTNNIWALTHMYYRLWLYYHLAGNNTQFWPRLFELCRQTPLINGSQISGETSLLRFYQHACDAAGEDLTEFFRAHGYLEVMDNRLVGDYSNGTYNQTQEQIDAAIAAVKAKNYPENLAVIFINDGTTETTLQHDGVTSRSLWDGSASAEYGSVNDYIDEEVSIETAYEATVDANGNVTMSGGTGGVGFLVLNEDGEIVSFSNKATFALSDEAAYLIATGAATISAVDANSETTEAEVDLSALQSALLSELIGKAQAIVDLSDDTNTKIGFYRASELTKLKSALETAKQQLSSGAGLITAYELLYAEYNAVIDNESSYIAFSPAHTYVLTNYAYPTRKMVVSSGVIYANENVSDTDNAARWQFKETSTAGVYNVYNLSGVYAPKIAQSSAMETTAEVADEAKYVVENLGNGLWAVSLTPWATNTAFHAASNDSYKVVGWGTGANATRWYLTAVELDEDVVAKDELAALVTKTQELIDKMATVEGVKTALGLQVTNSSNAYYLSCSNVDPSEGSMAELIDDNHSTYMHSNWHTGSISASNDWLDVDLGSGNALSMFSFGEVTRSSVYNDFPKTIEIYGSNTKSDNTSDYTLITTVTGLPQSGGQTWESDVISAVEDYRYLRFVVTTGNNRIYFHMAEFDLYSVVPEAAMLDDFTSVNTSLVTAAYSNMLKGTAWLNNDDATTANIETATTNLQTAYDALLEAYEAAIASKLDAEKATLQALIDQTNELINNVGSAEIILGGVVDLHGKIYCNAPYTAGGTSHSDYSSAENDYNLLDGNVNTHFHSDYNTSTMVADPYVRIDLGEGNEVSKFKFNYTTRNQTGCAPTAISVYGGNLDGEEISYTATPVAELTSADGLPTAASTKWVSNEITADKAYRYYKFVVTASQGTNSAGLYFVMSEFGFSKIAIENVAVDAAYADYIEDDFLKQVAYSVVNSEQAMDVATTAEQLQSQQRDLQANYDALLEAYNNAIDLDSYKDALQALIDQTDALLNSVADCEYDCDYEYLTLQNGSSTASYYISSNAGQNAADGNTGGKDDGAGIAGLLDEDPATYFHSRWGGAEVNEAHYLQIDLGTGNELSDFAFEYATRKAGSAGNTSPAPTAIEVRAGNDLATLGASTPIVTLTKDADELPAYGDLGASWTSDCISANESSRYIRLTVTNSAGPGSNKYADQYFFAMGTLKVAKAIKNSMSSATVAQKYTIAGDEAQSALSALNSAMTTIKGGTAAELEAQQTALQTAYDALLAAKQLADSYPVYLTVDAANPILYNIYINRSTTTVLQYDEASTMVAVDDILAGNKNQGWYFMAGADGKVKIYPYQASGNLLATNNYTEGAGRIEAVAEGTEGYGCEWSITKITDSEWYNISILNAETNYYFSNYGGTTNKMGFYNSSTSSDGGSMFKFELADYSKSDAYYQLYNYHLSHEKMTGSDLVGYCSSASAAAFNTAYDAATEILAAESATDAEYTECYQNMVDAFDAIEINMPEAGKFYTFKSAHTGYAANSYLYNEKTNLRVAWSTSVTAENTQAIWEFSEDGNSLYMTNLHTGCSLVENNYNTIMYTADEPTAVEILSLDGNGQVGVRVGTDKLVHAQNYQGNVVTWETKTPGSASAWYIEEVDNSNISYTASIGAAEWATLCLNYPVTVPEDVTAYAVVGVEAGSVLLQSVGDVIAAGVPVLLNAAQGDYEFNYTATGDAPETNLLQGSCYDVFVEAESGMQYYILALNEQGNVAMCIVYHEYNADGSLAGENTDNGTHFKNNANKVYLPIEQTTGSASRAYSLRILDGTTGIDAVVGEGTTIEGIYDLSGRRIKEMNAPGVYIVNGKKVIKK